MRLSVVLVHYRTPELAARAVAALDAAFERARAELGTDGEILVVDNGSDPPGREVLAALERPAATAGSRPPVRVLSPGENLGYAGGANLGIGEASGELLAVMNPDVEVEPGCLAALERALEDGAAAAGPRFLWHPAPGGASGLLLPPAEDRRFGSEILARLARPEHLGPFERAARRRWRRHARRHWEAEAPVESHHLSGALLAFRRDAWEAVGAFDPGYRLYFEETDWLHRLAAAGRRALHVPAARAVHLYDRSAAAEPAAPGWFAESERRFLRRRHGRAGAALLATLDRLPARRRRPAGDDLGPHRPRIHLAPPPGTRPPHWIEISPAPWRYPAAAERLAEAATWELPEAVWHRLTPGPYALTAVDHQGREWAHWQFHRPPLPAPRQQPQPPPNRDPN